MRLYYYYSFRLIIVLINIGRKLQHLVISMFNLYVFLSEEAEKKLPASVHDEIEKEDKIQLL